MKLDYEDARHFYAVFFPLLNYVNNKQKIAPQLKEIKDGVPVNPSEVYPIADYLWDHPALLDQYLKETALNEEDRKILEGWKRYVRGRFFIERFLKRGTVFIGEHNEVYMVSGTTTEMEENFYYQNPPILVETTLIPFKGHIITDGLLNTYSVSFGGGAKKLLKETYMDAKKAKKIITEL